MPNRISRDAAIAVAVERITNDIHEDQCNCREWPASCVSGLTRDRMEPSGIDATVHALADAGLLIITEGDPNA